MRSTGYSRRQGLLLALLLGVSCITMATEEPDYDVLASMGEVEIRRYGPAIQALTPMTSAGNSFKTLAGYIFGGNDSGEKIAMTAPVQENLAGEVRHMAFIMPAEYSMESLPTPNSSGVELRAVPARTVAVLTFSGWARDDKVARKRQDLEAFLADRRLDVRGNWLLNQYNPPWTPSFMRRNEIWVEVDWPAGEKTAVR